MGVVLDSTNVEAKTFVCGEFSATSSLVPRFSKAIAAATTTRDCYIVIPTAGGSADVVQSGINVSGGDSLFAAEMSQSLTPINRNSCLSSEQQRMGEGGASYRTECQPAMHRYLPSARREPISLMEVRSSPAQDLSHYNNSGSRLHCDEPTNVKGFPHIMLSSRRTGPAQWNIADGHHQALHGSPYFDDKGKTKNGDDYSVCGGQQPDYSAYNASLIQEYRQHQGSMPADQGPGYPTAEYHHALLPSVAGYGMYPLLPKQRHFTVKHETSEASAWDKKGLIGGASSSKLDRDSSYLKPPPVDLDDLSDDERERMRVKRERNRVAAAKCRNRRRELLERLEKEAEQLEREQEVLRDNVKKLQAQKRKLGSILDEHEPGCSNKVEEDAESVAVEKKAETV